MPERRGRERIIVTLVRIECYIKHVILISTNPIKNSRYKIRESLDDESTFLLLPVGNIKDILTLCGSPSFKSYE